MFDTRKPQEVDSLTLNGSLVTYWWSNCSASTRDDRCTHARLLLWGLVLLLGASLDLGGCTVYQTAPGVYTSAPPSSYDRAWSAALAAFQDQGVAVSSADRSTGVIQGRRGDIGLSATLRTQADGSVRVEFNSSGATAKDPELIQRVVRSYDARMGR